MSKKSKIYSWLIISSFLISSCGSNSAIKSAQRFGSLAAQFQDNTNKLANDIYDSCVRRVRYIQVDVNNQERNDALKNCEDLNKPAAARARDANKLVTYYMEAIGKLASDDIVSFDDELDRIQDSLNGLSIPTKNGNSITLPNNAVNTGTSIAKFIFGWAVNKSREGTLREAITCTNMPLQTYTDGLELTFQGGYTNGVLEQELSRINSYYDYYATILRAEEGSDKDFRAIQSESFNAIEPVLQRRNAALTYIAIIDRTSNAHAELAKLFLGDEDPPSESSCTKYLSDNLSDSDLESLENQQKLNFDFTLRELSQMKQIAINYQREVEPLLIKMEEELKN